MTRKLSTSSINYGSRLPALAGMSDGQIFFKTEHDADGVSNPPGLYVFTFIQDGGSNIGDQVASNWRAVSYLGTDAGTLDGLDSSAFQRADLNLSALSATQGVGLYVVTGDGTSATRTLLAGSSKITISNGSGSLADPVIDVVENNILLQNLGGILPMGGGGTGKAIVPRSGGIIYSTSSTLDSTPTGAAGQVLMSNGDNPPTWVNNAPSLSVGSASAVPWTGISGLDTFSSASQSHDFSTYTLHARPSYFFTFDAGSASISPQQFPPSSISAFDGYSTTDIGQYQVGITVIGSAGGGTRGLQLASGWNSEENAPSGLRFRVNDDTGSTNSWTPFRTIWDQGNLTNLSQLTNDVGFVLKSGDTMTGDLSFGLNSAVFNGIELNGANSTVIVGLPSQGSVKIEPSGNSNSAFIGFFGSNNVRAGYIGYTSNAPGDQESGDTGVINYVAASHAFAGHITATGNITAYSSDARLKKNVTYIENAVQKVQSLGGYVYDWDLEKCADVGFSPANPHEHGLIAQEVAKVMPDAVAPAPFDSDFLTVRYERIVALLTAAVREQQAQIDELQSRIKTLESK